MKYPNLAKNLKAHMNKRGYTTIASLAKAANVSHSELKQIYNGTSQEPRDTLLRPVAKILKITVATLRGEIH